MTANGYGGAGETQPLVTVITPAYNRADYLDEVIQSVLAQDYPNLEYIVLNDGSTDGTPEVMQRYADRIVAVSHPNMGETRTVNAGLTMAHGSIVGVVNSDDPLLPGAIRAAVEAMQADPNVTVVYPDWNMIDADGTFIKFVRTHQPSYVNMLRWHFCEPGPGAFFRKDVADRLEGRDPQFRYVADFDFWLRAGLMGPFKRIPQTLATFRSYPGGASSAERGHAMAEEHVRLIKKIYRLPGMPPEARKVRREAFSSAYFTAGQIDRDRSSKRKYFLLALLYSPQKYRGEYRRRLKVALPAVLGPFYRPVMAVVRRSRRLVRKVSRRFRSPSR